MIPDENNSSLVTGKESGRERNNSPAIRSFLPVETLVTMTLLNCKRAEKCLVSGGEQDIGGC